MSASGLPWLSAMICSQTAASNGPRRLSSRSVARIAVAESVDGQLREPGEDVVVDARPRRAHKRDPLREEAAGDEARICAEASSSHCASSTRQRRGCCSATSANSVSVASPTRNRSGRRRAQAEHRRERIALRGRERSR